MANQVSWKNVNFAVGDTIRINQTFAEGDKTRTQIFEGLVIAIRGHAGLKSFVVRKIAVNNVGVEKIFPIETPTITKVEVMKKGNVRRAKLYFLRGRIGKKATKVKSLFVKGTSQGTQTETIVKKATKDRPTTEEQPVKNKVSKADKPVKEKKVKKGPKKIVRKERQFVR
ncbi:50S ribosomal protein L19 [Candidatus Collierbacteria bacterium]|nr:50S ribosomal protein L19 [Candidatus Collierbacteria bacterium]